MYQQKLREQEKAYKRQEKQIKDSKSGGKSKKQAVRTLYITLGFFKNSMDLHWL